MSVNRPAQTRFNTVSAYLIVPNSVEALEFYQRAFNAEPIYRIPGPGGRTMHAEMRIGDSYVMMADENPRWHLKSPKTLGGCSCSLHLMVDDADALWEQALAAGCQVIEPIDDMFWGDRFGKVVDPYGHNWGIAMHQEELSPEEIVARSQRVFAEMRREDESIGGTD